MHSAMPRTPAPVARSCPPPATVTLRDGATVRLRDALPADVPRLGDMFFTLSDTTRYLYFCVGVPATDTWAERVAALGLPGGPASYAMVVEIAGAVVGVARFDRNPDSPTGEIGILLADAWQSRGVGRAVVARLRDEAVCRELAGFTATVLGENRRAFRLLRRAFPDMRAAWSYGQYVITMPFAPDPPAPFPHVLSEPATGR